MTKIFTYNPTGEMAVANGMVSYMPPKNLRKFENDLAFLPSYFASDGDVVITPMLPDDCFLSQWQQLGLSKCIYHPDFDLPKTKDLNICPWSWNPAIHHRVKNLRNFCSESFKQSPNFLWKDKNKLFFSRKTTNRIQNVLNKCTTNHPFISVPYPAIDIDNMADFDTWIEKQRAVILKMPWSSSGRGIHVVNPNRNLGINYPWIQGALKQQGFLTAEPLLNKVFDFSFQLEIKRNGDVKLLGYSYFINDEKGHFVGGNINWPHEDSDMARFLSSGKLQTTAGILIEAIKTVAPHNYYEGPIGVDAIVFKNKNGDMKIHPCVDINWRYNMGMINISLPKFVDSGSIGFWKISSFAPGGWKTFVETQKKEKPLTISNNKITSGFIELTPPNEDAIFGAWMEIQFSKQSKR